ncbi:MAG: hypothetical protein ABFR75_09160 [Acidobacteriota bacterium]
MKKGNILLTIFFITFSTVVFEILYTRIFSVIYLSSFAFLMISLALFGYGLSGFYMSLRKIGKDDKGLKYLEYFILGYALLLPIILKITLVAKVDFLNLFNPVTNLLLLIVNFVVLLFPFFAAGVSLVLIFTLYSQEIGKLYFIDLIGAALGGVAIIPLIVNFGPSRVILLLFFILSLLWFSISRKKLKVKISVLLILAVGFLGMYKFSEQLFPIVPKIVKRDYIDDYSRNRIEYSKWSPINKIDIVHFMKKKKIIWLDGGTQQSYLAKTIPNIDQLEPIEYLHSSIPYQLTKPGPAMIIGSAGGYEVLCAYSNKFKPIYAVEMDPEICDLVEDRYSEFIGDLFHKKGVYVINDEGRHVLKKYKKKYNVIQMVNSHNSSVLLAGGMSIAETYIYTVESFKDYWNHLNDDGYLSIVHLFGERMFTTALQALKEMNIEEPEKKFFVIQPTIPQPGFNFFFMKKGNISQSEIKILEKFAGSREIVYSPDRIKDNIYYDLAGNKFRETIDNSSVNVAPVYDNSPYFNQPNKIGQFEFSNNKIMSQWGQNAVKVNLKYSNSVYLSILVISILFSLLFIYLPLKIKTKSNNNSGMIFYFFLIGMAFITVEIILIKIFQLYLGNPAYSISAIIFALLVSSGIGSLLSEKINRIFGKKTILYLSIFIFSILAIYAFFLFSITYSLIQFGLMGRLLITVLLISVLGIPMGVMFPTGLRSLGKSDRVMIGWAWGANAFATVIGSVITVIIAINWNFSVSMILAALLYLLSGFIFIKSLKKIKA